MTPPEPSSVSSTPDGTDVRAATSPHPVTHFFQRIPRWFARWWGQQSPTRQDRFAMMGPLVAVVLFTLVMLVVFAYLHIEERAREQEIVTRDVEYAQQRLRLRLVERQEQLTRLSRQIANGQLEAQEFRFQAEHLVNQYPELLSVIWVDDRRRIRSLYTSLSATPKHVYEVGDLLLPAQTGGSYDLARELRQPVYSGPLHVTDPIPSLMVVLPVLDTTDVVGMVIGEYAIDHLMRVGVPSEVMSRYAVTLIDDEQRVLAGRAINTTHQRLWEDLPWDDRMTDHSVAVSPVGHSLLLRAQSYRTSQDMVGGGFMWLMGGLSVLTVWTLWGTWRHTRRRIQAQQALQQETNFRRAMENSMLTGMRALDLQGRITYVNPAFCSMTGWTEQELIGQTAPFSYWAEEDKDMLMEQLHEELSGSSNPAGFEVRVRRRNGQLFHVRMYVSPLIDPSGIQTGWMTSMTDISEPRRIRQELTASYDRFTTVLESLDAAVSVVPLGSEELLFGNKMYRLWFGSEGRAHQEMADASGMSRATNMAEGDHVDVFAGLPTDALTDARTESSEIYVEELGKWFEMRLRYVTWVDGRLAQMAIATDITPRRHAEQLAAEQAERAEKASRLITMGEMASSVAHELNQPLTAISNYCSGMMTRLQKKQIDEEGLLAALDKTAKQAQRAGQVVQRIRAFVKRSEPNRTPSDVNTMVNNAIELADIELRRQQVRINHYIAARLPTLLVDPILIEQVLINLIKNGAESILQAQRPVHLRLLELKVLPKRVDGADVVEFSVRDNGNGVPDELLERIYEAFYSTKSEGMGIGLKLCRSIVESHLGRIKVENLYNASQISGCVFSFWIPVQSTVQPTLSSSVNPHPVQ